MERRISNVITDRFPLLFASELTRSIYLAYFPSSTPIERTVFHQKHACLTRRFYAMKQIERNNVVKRQIRFDSMEKMDLKRQDT